jgi:uncharacterized protein
MTGDPVNIRYPFAIDNSRGRLDEEPDHAAHVRQLLLQLLYTAPGERTNRPDFGCGIKRLVFAPNSDVSASLAQVTIFSSIEKWLCAYVRLTDVKVQALNEVLEIRIAYILKARGEKQYLNVEVSL